MIRIRVLATCLSAWLLLLACSARLQSDERRGDSQEREAFFEALREFVPHKELFDLVRHESIRSEIKLSEADAKQIEENLSKSFEAMHKIREDSGGKGLSADELGSQMQKALEPLNDASYAILAKSDFKRLLGLYVQARGYRALLNDQVAGHIGLEGEALAEFRKTRSERWQAIMEDVREAMKREIRNAPPHLPPPRDVFTKLFQQAEEKLDLKLSQELTYKQKQDLEALKGAQFALPKHPFNYGPPSGRNHGRNGGRGPGDKGPDPKRGAASEPRECKSDERESSATSDRDNVLALPSSRS